ncbi:receptor-type tyrosine-protein phosphatase alpha-like [Watersipora subatra]|uniref:receptor-type tyrosine-protein phosphatase alpha-like n=1 Tax=Watersipora subatra TaxID=2589382 RepID=UPI00355B6136
MRPPENGPEVQKESGKTALTAATKTFFLKHLFTLEDISMLEIMDSTCDTSLRDLLTSVTISLKEAGEVLNRPTPANVVAYKGNVGETGTRQGGLGHSEPAVLELTDKGVEALLKETSMEDVEEVSRVAAIKTGKKMIKPSYSNLTSSSPAKPLCASTLVRETGQNKSPPARKPIVRTVKYLSAWTTARVEEQMQGGSGRTCQFATSRRQITLYVLRHYAITQARGSQPSGLSGRSVYVGTILSREYARFSTNSHMHPHYQKGNATQPTQRSIADCDTDAQKWKKVAEAMRNLTYREKFEGQEHQLLLKEYRCNVFNSTSPKYTTITVPEELVLCDYQPGDLVICEVRASTDVGYGPSANNETSVYCGVPGKAMVQETQMVVYNNGEMRELINMNFTWMPVIPNCRRIANYSISLFYNNQLLKTQINEADKRDFNVKGLYPYTNFILLISTTNDEGFSSDSSYPTYTQETSPTDSPYLILEFSSSCVELTIGSPRLTNGLLLTYSYSCQDSQSQLRNSTYSTLDASNITRDSFPKVCGFLPASRITCSVYASNTAGDSPTANVIGYTQLQLADASITRTEHLVAFSTVSKGFSHTSILLKPVDLINVLRNESYYQIIVQAPGELNRKRKKRYAIFKNSTCDSDSLYSYEKSAELSMTCYITAEIPGSSVTDDGLTVNIGDGQTLNNYYNAPLEPETNYTLAVGLVVYPEEGQFITYYMEPVQFHSYREIEITAAEPPTQLNIGIGVGVSLAVLITAGVVIFFLYQRRKPSPDDSDTDDVSLSHLDPPRPGENRPPVPEKPVGLPSRPRPAPPTPAFPTTQPISLSHLTDYITDKEAIFSEYNDVLKKMPKPTMNVALLPENRGKCKYIGLYPEDEHRVILDRTDDEETDFINASFLEGYEKGELFIASQGPLETTIDDFWLMIFQQRPKAIVMVTNTVEMGKHKCEQYWPEDVGGVMKFRDIKVTLTTCDIWADYVVRSLSVTKGGETFKTKQFHFTSWPDHGVPAEMSPYVTFYKKVKEGTQHLTRPMLVHCSAGVGRTGTFISCWNLLKEAKKTQAVDVLGCVTAMRLRRPCMVQVKEQYYFLHCVVEEILKTETFACAPLGTEAKLNFYYEQNGGANDAITAEFKRIEMRLAAMGQRTFSGLEDDNRDKNRSMQVLPDKSHCVYINSGDYINAVLLDGYRFTKQIVCTQLPLANTVADFWRMVEEQEIKIVVQLEQEDTQFYPTDDGEVLVCTNYTIHRLAMETNEHLSFISLAVTCTLSNQRRTVSVLLTKEWNKRGDINELPNHVALLHHLEALEKLLRQNGDGKFCVADKLGTTRCGLIVTAYNALAKLKTEQEVDLYNTVLMARCRRKQFISTIEEYMFLYDLLKHYTDSFSDYANFK